MTELLHARHVRPRFWKRKFGAKQPAAVEFCPDHGIDLPLKFMHDPNSGAECQALRGAKQKPVPNLSEAIRRLVELGLKAKK